MRAKDLERDRARDIRQAHDQHKRNRLILLAAAHFAVLVEILVLALIDIAAVIVTSLIITLLNVIVPKIIGFTVDSVLGDEPVPQSYGYIVGLFGGIDHTPKGRSTPNT